MSMLFKRIKDWAVSIASFRTGDVIAVDGPNGTAKMSKDDLLKEASQNALAGNLAPAFDPTRTSENPYLSGESVVHDGELRTFVATHYGVWNQSKTVSGTANLSVCPLEFFRGQYIPVSDLDNALDGVIYIMRKDVQTNVANFPQNISRIGSFIIYTIKSNRGAAYDRYQVIKHFASGDSWYRIYQSQDDSWGAWIYVPKLPDNAARVETNQIIDNWSQNLDDLNNAEDNSTYVVQRTANTQTLNLPTEYVKGIAILQTYISNNSRGLQKFQVLHKLGNGDWWFRTKIQEDSWDAWIYVPKLPDNAARVEPNQIIDNWSQNLDDLNNAEDNSTYIVQRTANTQTLNLPTEYVKGIAILQTYISNHSRGSQKFQVLHKLGNGDWWYRSKIQEDPWSAWTYVPKLPDNIAYVAPKQIFDSWSQNLDDLNNAEDNYTYIVQRTANTQTLNLPTEYVTGLAILQTYISASSSTNTQKLQVLHKLSNGDRWYRYTVHNSWSAWTYVPGNSGSSSSGVIEIGPGKTYTTLRAGIAAAFLIKNCRVEIFPATYDLVAEFSDKISSSMTYTGLTIGNGMYLHFHQGAKVTALFDENDYDATTWQRIYIYFEPFRLGGGDFTIENLHISAKDCRYCVHDDSGYSQNPYTHRYINCVMEYENTHTTDINFAQCIGGGLGKLGYIYIDGGRYKSITSGGFGSVYGDASLSQRPISYHNSAATDCESAIYIRNVYLEDKGYFQIIDHGTSTKVTKVQIDSCSYEYPPLHVKTSSGVPDNMEVIEWGNNKRTSKHWVVESDNFHAQLVDD